MCLIISSNLILRAHLHPLPIIYALKLMNFFQEVMAGSMGGREGSGLSDGGNDSSKPVVYGMTAQEEAGEI